MLADFGFDPGKGTAPGSAGLVEMKALVVVNYVWHIPGSREHFAGRFPWFSREVEKEKE
jgi:hypothetical protein